MNKCDNWSELIPTLIINYINYLYSPNNVIKSKTGWNII